ncbi:MBL fold metallo-hydrolase [Hyphobacterium sp. CCMP332]|nr:MBL fold metallo-hydrolase [Hyphobacterium sp. CCMP332]
MAELQVMGSGDAFGSGGKMQTCFWINWNKKNLLVDCGATSSVAIKSIGKKIEDIDVIFISHLHGDHIGGIPFILMELAYVAKDKNHRIEIFGPGGTKKRLQTLQNLLYPDSLRYTEAITEFREYSGADTWHDFSIETYDVQHSELSYPKGLRISHKGKIFAFSGDGEWSNNLLKLSDSAELFICECYNYQKTTPGHLNYLKLTEMYHLLSCKNIFLNHPGPELLDNIEKVEIPFLQDSQIIKF